MEQKIFNTCLTISLILGIIGLNQSWFSVIFHFQYWILYKPAVRLTWRIYCVKYAGIRDYIYIYIYTHIYINNSKDSHKKINEEVKRDIGNATIFNKLKKRFHTFYQNSKKLDFLWNCYLLSNKVSIPSFCWIKRI